MALLDLGGPLRQFGLETSPCSLVVESVLLLEQPEGFLCAKLSDPCKVLHPMAIQYFSSLQFARPRAQRAFDCLGLNGCFCGHG